MLPLGHALGVASALVEVETPEGCSISVGAWRERDDGWWSLDIVAALADEPEGGES